MREIKFRAWIKPIGRMTDSFNIIEIGKGVKDTFKNAEIMQYTGLKDKNRKEIYEGDILKSYDGKDARICEVYYEAPRFKVKYPPHKFDGDLGFFMSLGGNKEQEVIGNIWENPELVERSDTK